LNRHEYHYVSACVAVTFTTISPTSRRNPTTPRPVQHPSLVEEEGLLLQRSNMITMLSFYVAVYMFFAAICQSQYTQLIGNVRGLRDIFTDFTFDRVITLVQVILSFSAISGAVYLWS